MGMFHDWLRQRQWKRDMREVREMARLIDTGETDLHVVGVTPSGKEVQVPTPLLDAWNELTPEAQQDALAAMDEVGDQ